MKSRIYILFVGILGLWSFLVLRAAYLQILPNERLEKLQNRQFQTVINLQSRRGAITDRNGRDLAISMTSYSVYADPKIIDDKKTCARKLAKIFGAKVSSFYAKIKDDKKRFIWIERQIEKPKADLISDLKIRGLSIVEEYKRVYPNDQLLSNALGFIGREGQGLEGLELFYDQQLQGNKKKVVMRRDARGRPLIADGMMFAENPEGTEIKLTIDSELQHKLDTELEEAINKFDADQAVGVVLDAKTSEILALSSSPQFDSNLAMSIKSQVRRNRVITDMFEPGSTMKTFIIAKAFNENQLAPNTKIDTENGILKIGKRTIREAETSHKWSQLTASEILAYSSNVGASKIAFKLGSQSVRQALVDFGFGQKTNVDLPGESRGNLQSLPWGEHLLANVSFGHGVAVNALQMANAYAAIANGGQLMQPYIVKSLRDSDSGETVEVKSKMIRQVVRPEVANQMKMMLTSVTAPGGSGVNAKVDGFIVAGKTGTAQKVNPNGLGYLPNGYISSFAGFIPANDPKYVIYVVVDHPKKNAYYGSQVAAPIFSRVASYAVRKAGLAPVLLTEKNLVDKDLAEKNVAIKKQAFKKLNEKIQEDERLSHVDEDLTTISSPSAVARVTVPNFTGLSMREVIQKVSGQNMEIKFKGQGLVKSSYPEPGQTLPDSGVVTVILE